MLPLSIILPISGETDNSASLLSQLEQALIDVGLSAEIILVTEHVSAELSQACQQLNQTIPVQLISPPRPESSTAVIMEGMQAGSGQNILVLDTAYCQSPEIIKSLYSPLQDQQTDFVLATFPGNTHSMFAGWLTRPLTKTKALQTGCFAISRNRFEQCREILNPASPQPVLEFLVKSRSQAVVEVPLPAGDLQSHQRGVSFSERVRWGVQLKELYEFKFKNYAYFLQFAIVGSSGVIVNLLALSLLLNWMIRPVAVAMAIWIAMTSNFLLNRHVTFSYARHAPILKQYLAYCGSCLTGNFFNWLTTLVLCGSISYFAERTLIAALIGILVGMGFNFLLCRLLVFGKHKADATVPKTNPAGKSQSSPG
ncbi:GtrA family protein [Gimesia panareensis]|uniref:GtrA-like protein n=1 Tax=Gimesia panareensis TaxID=2527978 RepID=A0A517QBY0_9PLAN|nr:GtrA family protein [Gimesia panareensis]QDT29132.1 GtrA-like protein [Gimesia panareensis]QDU51985.1 GtrA-like protein [Gimesia panareensis]